MYESGRIRPCLARIGPTAVAAALVIASCAERGPEATAPKPAKPDGQGNALTQETSGVTFQSDNRFVTARDGNTILWQVDAVAAAPGPIAGEPVIRDLRIAESHVHVVVGKHTHITLDKRTGEVLDAASD